MKPTDLTRHIALFQSPYGTTAAWEMVGNDPDAEVLEGWTRVSDFQAVTFQPLGKDAIVGGQLKALSKMRTKTVDEFKAKLDNIDGRMANLRALTDGSGT